MRLPGRSATFNFEQFYLMLNEVTFRASAAERARKAATKVKEALDRHTDEHGCDGEPAKASNWDTPENIKCKNGYLRITSPVGPIKRGAGTCIKMQLISAAP